MRAAPTTPTPWPTAIRVSGLEKSFGEGDARVHVLKQTAFEAREGEMMFLVGPSGCGKTTLLSIIAGTLHGEGGEVEVLGHRLHTMRGGAVTAFRARHIGFIFQQFNLIPTLTVVENVSVPLVIQGERRRVAERRAREVLELVGIPEKADQPPGKLSGGQQQRVAIARALVHRPPLIICDEPTASLDRENGFRVMELLREVARDTHRCVVVVTHDPRTYAYADRMSEMEDGRILRVLQSPEEIRREHSEKL
jgi:putative ABC transport system ATP-binding protein